MDEGMAEFKFMLHLIDMYRSELVKSLRETNKIRMDLYRAESFIKRIGRMEEYHNYCIEKEMDYEKTVIVSKD